MAINHTFLQEQEALEFLNIFLDQLRDVKIEFADATNNKSVQELQKVSLAIHTVKGSSGSCGFDFAPIICRNLEDTLYKIRQSGFASESVEMVCSLLTLLEDYFISKTNNLQSDDDDFAVRMHAIFSAATDKVVNRNLTGLRGLIVEDSKVVGKKIADSLGEHGIQCSFASSGLEALNRLSEEYYDFIVTGYFTKKINGYELVEMLKISSGKNPLLKTCIITSADNVVEQNKSAHLVLKKDNALTQNLINYLVEEFKFKPSGKKVKNFNKILLVDDDPVIRKLLQAVFAKEKNLQVEIAASGADALSKVQKFHPEVIILDYMMSELSGAETLKILKVLDHLKDTHFYFLTGKTRPEEVEELMSLGVNGVLAKPFAPDRLVSSIIEKYNTVV